MISIDIVSFTETSAKMSSMDVCKLLAGFYSRVDKLSTRFNIDKIDIIGDAYIAVTPLADDAVAFCLSTLAIAKYTMWDKKHPELGMIHLRCAVHTGKITGLVLDSIPFKYTLVGETVVKTKTLEELAPPGHVNISAETAKYLDNKRFHLISHKGHPDCYLVYHAKDIMANQTVMHYKSLKLESVCEEFSSVFGFDPIELTSMRVLFGPNTRQPAIHMAIEQCRDFNHPASIPVVLYSKSAVSMCTSLEFQKSPLHEEFVTMKCSCLSCQTPIEIEAEGLANLASLCQHLNK